jgi:monoamine oxidase
MSMVPEYDVAVIGGGVSGIYTAWRMLTSQLATSPELSAWAKARGGTLKVAVFEGSNRIGGRLLSARPPGMPHVTAEIGGMRYVSSQTLVKSLIENELQLPRHEQVVDQPQNLAYLRGARLRFSDLTKPERLPYNLSEAEADWLRSGQTASTLISWAIAQLLPEVATLTGTALDDYLRSATIDERPLYQHGFWNLIARALSFEGYQLSRTTIGYDGLAWNANAVDMTIESFGFTPDVKYYLLDDGYEMVPWTLARRFEERGGEIHHNTWLQGFDETKLADGTTGVALHFKERKTTAARAIVLAMPPRSIQLLRQQGPVLDPERSPRFQTLLHAVEPLPLYKMFICYPYPWWETAGVSQGRSLTDIPMRQVYYWGVEGKQWGANPNNTNATIMVYNDATSVDFWGGLRNIAFGPDDTKLMQSPGGAVLPRTHLRAPHAGPAFARKKAPRAHEEAPIKKGPPLEENWRDNVAPAMMVAEMHRELMQLHGLRYAPEPFEAAFMDWSDDPYGGAVHFWNPGHKSWEVLVEMTKPVPDFPCYVCGEAWSTNQTWVEGALQTAEIVLQQRFGLSPPSWLTAP